MFKRYTKARHLSPWVMLLGLFLLMSGRAKAQEFVGKVIGGINGSQVDGDGLYGFNKPGLLLGVGASFPLTSRLSLEPEALYSQMGSRSSQDELDQGLPLIVFRLNYVDLPIILNYKVREDFVVQGGLSPNVLLGATIDNGSNLGPVDRQEFFSRMDYRLIGGIEYLVGNRIGLNMRWTYSILPINASRPDPATYLVPLRFRAGFYNHALQFSIRYYLRMGG